MSEKEPKIVLYKEDVEPGDYEGIAASAVKGGEVVDAFSVMQTEFEPGDATVPINYDGGFFAANLTASEAKKVEGQTGVEAVEDDEWVYADGDLPGDPMDDTDDDGLGDVEPLELDLEDTEALEEDPYPGWELEDFDFTLEQVSTLTQNELDPGTEDELAELLLDGIPEAEVEALRLPRIPKEKLGDFLKCVLKCMLEQAVKPEEVSDEHIEAAVRAVGLAEGPEVQAYRDYIPRNIRQIYANYAWRYSTGAGVRVAVVDTGIARRHPDLRVWGGVSYVPGVTSWNDDHSHGTHVAGTIAALMNRRGIVGVAPAARLYAVKVLNRAGRGRLSWILNGLIWCYRTRMHVLNMSLGSAARTHDPRVYSLAYERVGKLLRRRGILVVAAAGNDYHRPVGNPARCPSYMAVSAIDSRYRLAAFSNIGPQVEICAPGVNILSTIPPNGYGRKSGTSMSTPHVAGVAALVKRRHPGWHGDRIRVHLWRTARDLGRPGRDPFYGYGMVHAWRAVR